MKGDTASAATRFEKTTGIMYLAGTTPPASASDGTCTVAVSGPVVTVIWAGPVNGWLFVPVSRVLSRVKVTVSLDGTPTLAGRRNAYDEAPP